MALGHEAIRQGLVLLVTAPPSALADAHAEGRHEDRLSFFAKPKLLIVDELGYPAWSQTRVSRMSFRWIISSRV